MQTYLLQHYRKHARCSASAAYRWINCPGSVALSDQCPDPGSSSYADEGTVAHNLAELKLRHALHEITDAQYKKRLAKIQQINAWVRIAVTAAEQIYIGSGRGTEKKEYVINWLHEHGVTVDESKLDALIEAAVYSLNNGFLTIGATTEPATSAEK